MPLTEPRLAPPSDDRRWKMVAATMRRNGNDSQALIETLHTVQEVFGYIDDVALRYVARSLRTPMSRAYGVATFYHYFTLKPPGKHTCVVCTGTACHIQGAERLLKAVEREYSVRAGETSSDGELSVAGARCIGSCSLAPAVVLDGKVIGNLQEKALIAHLKEAVK